MARLGAGATAPVTDVPGPVRRELAAELAPLVAAHEPLWLARNRPGGRSDSVSRLERLQELLTAG